MGSMSEWLGMKPAMIEIPFDSLHAAKRMKKEIEEAKKAINEVYGINAFEAEESKRAIERAVNDQLEIRKVIFNEPYTIILWEDNTKTIVKCCDGETYDKEKGLAMAIVKKLTGNKSKYNKIFKQWCK